MAGEGKDSVDVGSGNDYVLLSPDASGMDYVMLSVGADTLLGQANLACIYVVATFSDTAPDLVITGSGSDTVLLGSGNDRIFAGNGSDTVFAGEGSNIIDLGEGSDSVSSGSGADSVSGVADLLGDRYVLGGGADTVFAGGGADWIDVTAATGDGSDYVEAGAGDDTVVTGSGNDTVMAGEGKDSVDAGIGADYLDLSTGADSVYLGDSDNVYWSADTSGDGNPDRVFFDVSVVLTGADSFSDVVFNFTVGLGADSIGFYGLVGLNVADSLSSNPGWVEGGFLLNGSGADTIFSDLLSAISTIELLGADSLKYDLDPNEVFLFRVGPDSYIGMTDGIHVTSVVKLIGVSPAAGSFDLMEGSIDGLFYLGPNGT